MKVYRKDIDGLRAIAVLSIFVFHINKDWLPGGFVGVDVFFVISGFLITSIIHQQMQENSFTVKDFYLRRIKRIVPAALFYSMLIIAVAYQIYLPKDYLVVVKSAIASSLFLSNIYFMRNVDYFSPQAEENPLLHTWSLSVEEQFYLVWPLLLLLSYKYLKSDFLSKWGGLIIIIASFLFAHLLATEPATQKSAFYLMPTRFGEFMIGAMLGIGMKDRHYSHICRLWMATIGLAMLVVSFLFIDENTLFPGMYAVFPCVATGLLILAGNTDTTKHINVITASLSNRVLTYIGAISFSLYLAHWPVLAFTRYMVQSYELSALQVVFVAVGTFLLAHMSWKYIETPFRQSKWSFNKVLCWFYILPTLLILLFCLVGLKTGGNPARFGLSSAYFNVANASTCADRTLDNCKLGKDEKEANYYLTGDSHGAFYSSLFDELGRTQGFSVEAQSISDCAGVFTQHMYNLNISMLSKCKLLKKRFQEKVRDYEGVIIAERWEARVSKYEGYVDSLTNSLDELSRQGKQVILLLQVPKYHCDVNRYTLLSAKFSYSSSCDMEIDEKVREANNIISRIAGDRKNVRILGIDEYLCPQGVCAPTVDSQLVYADDDHLNLHGATLVAKKIAMAPSLGWKSFLEQQGKPHRE